MNTSNTSSDQQFSVWAWMTFGVVGYQLCTNAIEIYGFFDAWNRISRSCRMDVKAARLSKQRLVRRKNHMQSSLTTQPFRSASKEESEDIQTTNEDKAKGMSPNPHTAATPTSHTECDTCCCPICLSEFQDNELVSCSSSNHPSACDHLFHTQCLGAWLSKHSSCPICRFEMLAMSEEKTRTSLSVTGTPAPRSSTI